MHVTKTKLNKLTDSKIQTKHNAEFQKYPVPKGNRTTVRKKLNQARTKKF